MSRHSGNVRAISAAEVKAGDILIGDPVSPQRYGTGTVVLAVENFADWVLIWTERGDIEHTASHTVYVADGDGTRVIEARQVRAGDVITTATHPHGPFNRVLRVDAAAMILHACPEDACRCPPGQPREIRLAWWKVKETVRLRITE